MVIKQVKLLRLDVDRIIENRKNLKAVSPEIKTKSPPSEAAQSVDPQFQQMITKELQYTKDLVENIQDMVFDSQAW